MQKCSTQVYVCVGQTPALSMRATHQRSHAKSPSLPLPHPPSLPLPPPALLTCFFESVMFPSFFQLRVRIERYNVGVSCVHAHTKTDHMQTCLAKEKARPESVLYLGVSRHTATQMRVEQHQCTHTKHEQPRTNGLGLMV